MEIIYFSSTNNIHNFLRKCALKGQKGSQNLRVNEDFILLTFTTGMGEIPAIVKDFLEYEDNHKHLKYVVGSGNKNWGDNYCKASYDICKKYNCELLMNFELSGNTHDIAKFKSLLEEIECL